LTSLGVDTTAPYSINWNSVAAGSYALTARATDNQGATTTSSAVNITVTGGSTPIPRDGLASVSYNAATNRINSAGWEYDAAGNQTRLQRDDGSWQRLVYDAAGRLVKVTDDANNTVILHTYGASNHRLIEQVGNESSNNRTYYVWEGDATIAEYEETSSNPTTPRWTKSYLYLGARLLATLEANGATEATKFYHPDRLGTRLVSNPADGSQIEQATLPFGTALDAESTGATKRRFTSYDRSSVSGLDYAVNRHYDPLQGRFTQVDPIGMSATNLQDPQSLNLYSYVGNDPINRTDPDGQFWGAIGRFFKSVGIALGAIGTAILKVLNNRYVKLGITIATALVSFGVFSGILLRVIKKVIEIYNIVADSARQLQLYGLLFEGKFKQLGNIVGLAVVGSVLATVEDNIQQKIIDSFRNRGVSLSSFLTGLREGIGRAGFKLKQNFTRSLKDFFIPFYGNFCAPGNVDIDATPGVDGTDEGCKLHDKAYQQTALKTNKSLLDADKVLVKTLLTAVPKGRLVDRILGTRFSVGTVNKFLIFNTFAVGFVPVRTLREIF